MKKEYDFSNAEQGKFYVPMDEIKLPIYLDKDVESFLSHSIQKSGKSSLQAMVNELLRKDIEIAKRVLA
jgi:hypothetical protein